MSAGDIIGTGLGMVIAGGLWTIVGWVIDRIATLANVTFMQMPVYQDGITGFNMMTGIYGILLVIVWLGFLINYVMNQNSNANREV